MTYLLDTNAFSDLMRKHAKLDARMASLFPAERVVICTIVRGEIRFGLNNSHKVDEGRTWKIKRHGCLQLFLASRFLKQPVTHGSAINRSSRSRGLKLF